MTPPSLPIKLLEQLLPKSEQAAILGDLEEEFNTRSEISNRKARIWVWRQMIGIIGFTLRTNLSDRSVWRRLFAVAGVAFGIFVFIFGWDVFISRNFARFLGGQADPLPQKTIRIIYFAVQFAGAVLMGFLVARFAFRKAASFIKNALLFLCPVIALLIVEAFYRLFIAGSAAGPAYYLLRVVVVAAALVTSAYFTSARRS